MMRVILAASLMLVAALAGCTDVADPAMGSDEPASSGGSSGGSSPPSGSGSSGDASGSSSPALGSASIYVQDAPEDHFSEVHVVFTHVLVHAAGDDNDTEEDEGSANETEADNSTADGNSTVDGNETVEDNESEDDGSWIEVVNNTDGIDIDLLNFSGNTAAFLGEEELLAGKYTQIRIHVIEAYGIDHDGNRTNISLANGVLKVVKSFDVEAGMESRILIDVDLDKSLKETGKKGWKMTPVIGKTVVDIVEDDSSGEEVHSEGDGTELEDIGGA